MTEGPKKAAVPPGHLFSGKADAVAERALSLVANRVVARGRIDQVLLARLEAALLEPHRAAREAVVDSIRAAGVAWDDLVDHYIPEAARRLGQHWCEDAVSFVDVTIGTARLQALLRDFGQESRGEEATDPRAPSVLLSVRQDQYHTLGAMVAAAQLRRAGLSVRLALGLNDRTVADLVAAKRFDAVFLSASSSETLESMRDLVNKIRTAGGKTPPIVLGGGIVETDRDARALTGADHATSDTFEAMQLCGLTVPSRDAGFTAMRS